MPRGSHPLTCGVRGIRSCTSERVHRNFAAVALPPRPIASRSLTAIRGPSGPRAPEQGDRRCTGPSTASPSPSPQHRCWRSGWPPLRRLPRGGRAHRRCSSASTSRARRTTRRSRSTTRPDASVDLSRYRLRQYFQRQHRHRASRPVLNGTVAAGDVFVFAHGNRRSPRSSPSPTRPTAPGLFNGDDAVVLREGRRPSSTRSARSASIPAPSGAPDSPPPPTTRSAAPRPCASATPTRATRSTRPPQWAGLRRSTRSTGSARTPPTAASTGPARPRDQRVLGRAPPAPTSSTSSCSPSPAPT